MTKRRRFTDDFKARVALEALRGDKTVQEIASKHKVHPNQVSTWKRQAIDGLADVFSTGPERVTANDEAEIHDLHAKIGQLTVERDLCPKGSSDEPGRSQSDDPSRQPGFELEPPVPDGFDQPVILVSHGQRRER